jgi:hypothetical protein
MSVPSRIGSCSPNCNPLVSRVRRLQNDVAADLMHLGTLASADTEHSRDAYPRRRVGSSCDGQARKFPLFETESAHPSRHLAHQSLLIRIRVHRPAANSALPKNPDHRFLTLFSGLSKALKPILAPQSQKRLLASDRGFL